jgi:hypothetical protein
MAIESTSPESGAYRFNTGIEGVSEALSKIPTIPLRPGGLLRQDSNLGSKLEELYSAGKLDELLYESVKPATQLTTRSGSVVFSSSLRRILQSLPEIMKSHAIPDTEVSSLEETLREDLNNQELLAACRRALLGG